MGNLLSCPSRWAPSPPLDEDFSQTEVRPPPYWGEVATFVGDQWPVALANTMEWFEFFAYAGVEPWISQVFFGGSHTAAWMGFGATFLVRPLGGLVFGMVADTYGRRPAVLLSLSVMCGATVGQGLVPVVPHLGPSLLLTCRVLQGIATGGETGSILVFLAEKAPPRVLGMSGVIFVVGAQVGATASTLTTVLLISALTENQMLRWGWRVPFLISLLPGGLALYHVWGINETTQFEKVSVGTAESSHESAEPQAPMWHYWLQSPLAMAGVSAGFAQCYVTSGPYFREWLVRWLGMTQGQAYKMLFLGQMSVLVPLLPIGMLADTVGLGTTHTMSGLSIALLSAPLYLTLLHFPTSAPVIVSVGIVLPAVLQASTVCGFAWITGLFPPQVRGRYVSVAFNFAGLVGGFGPMLCSLSTDPLFPAYYCTVFGVLSATACITSVWLHRRYLRTRKGLRTAYLLEDPF